MFTERIQPAFPETLVESKPEVYPLERLGTKPITALPADLPNAHQPCFAQNCEMLRNRRAAHGKVLGEGVDGLFSLREKIEQSAARRVGDGVEHILRHALRKHSLTLLWVSYCLLVKRPEGSRSGGGSIEQGGLKFGQVRRLIDVCTIRTYN